MRLILYALLLAASGACYSQGALPRPTHLYPFSVETESDPGVPLGGVLLLHGGAVLAKSDQTGRLRLDLPGEEGARLRLELRCPAGHYAAESVIDVVLRHYVNDARPILTVACPPVERNLALVVRAPLAPGLPLLHRGRTLSTLDENGVAHLLLTGRPGDTFDVILATDTRPRLRPNNPGARFELGDADQVALFEPQMELEPVPTVKRRSRKVTPGPVLPQRIR